MSRVLVSGANGFIGSHLVRKLLQRGHEVACLIRHTSDISSLEHLPVRLFIGDVRQPETLIEPTKNVEYVYHLAAELMVTNCRAFLETNAGGTVNMLEAVEKNAKSSIKRFLLVSSQAAAGPPKSSTPIDETVPLNPMSWYGLSKKKAEEAARSFGDRLPITIVRPSSVYGERDTDLSQIYPIVENRIQPKIGLKKKYVVMVYVDDLVDGFIRAAESDKTLNKAYFLNHREVMTTKAFIRTTAKAMGKSFGLMLPIPNFLLRLAAPITELFYHFTRLRPKLTRDKAREMSQQFWVADPSRAKSDFGWEARHNLTEGTIKTIGYFRAQEKMLREMALEGKSMLWVKYLLCSLVTGAVIEILALMRNLYWYDPWWGVFVTIGIAFGLALGSLAMLLRKMSALAQLLIATVPTGLVEAMNSLGWIPSVKWNFPADQFLGTLNLWVRSLILGLAGGVFVMIVNYFMRLLYKRRLRLG